MIVRFGTSLALLCKYVANSVDASARARASASASAHANARVRGAYRHTTEGDIQGHAGTLGKVTIRFRRCDRQWVDSLRTYNA